MENYVKFQAGRYRISNDLGLHYESDIPNPSGGQTVPSIQDYATVSGKEVTLIDKTLSPTGSTLKTGVLVAADANGSPLVTVNPATKTYALHNGATLKPEWVETTGDFGDVKELVIRGPELYRLLPCTDDMVRIETVGRDVVFVRESKFRRFTFGDKYIEFRSDGKVYVKGWGPLEYADWNKGTAKPLDVDKIVRYRDRFHNGSGITYAYLNRRGMLDRGSNYNNRRYIQVTE